MKRQRNTGRTVAVIVSLAGLLAISGCGRNKLKLTECVDGRPVIERTLDVAPPNCAPVEN